VTEKSKPDLKTKNVKEDNRNSETNKLPSNSNSVEEPGSRSSAFAETRSPDVVEQARERTTRVAEEVIKARKATRDYERRVAGAFQDLDNSATAPVGDTEFPKDWKERTKGRSAGIQLTAKEKGILTALSTPLEVKFQNTKLEDVIDYLHTITSQPIILDREALKEADASYDSPITLNVKGVSFRTVLRRVLADLGLTYVIRDEAIQVTSAQRAKELMVTRRYYVGDLIANLGGIAPVNPLPAPGPVISMSGLPFFPYVPPGVVVSAPANSIVPPPPAAPNAELMKQAVEQLREMIEESVDTQSWRSHGGAGTITFHAPTMSFIIRQSAEVHGLLGAGLMK
jgi:hypothetical protein